MRNTGSLWYWEARERCGLGASVVLPSPSTRPSPLLMKGAPCHVQLSKHSSNRSIYTLWVMLHTHLLAKILYQLSYPLHRTSGSYLLVCFFQFLDPRSLLFSQLTLLDSERSTKTHMYTMYYMHNVHAYGKEEKYSWGGQKLSRKLFLLESLRL